MSAAARPVFLLGVVLDCLDKKLGSMTPPTISEVANKKLVKIALMNDQIWSMQSQRPCWQISCQAGSFQCGIELWKGMPEQFQPTAVCKQRHVIYKACACEQCIYLLY